MSQMAWSWKEHWMWFDQLESNRKSEQWKELLRDDWLPSLPDELQFEVLKDSPDEVLYSLKHLPYVKRNAILKIDKYLRKKR